MCMNSCVDTLPLLYCVTILTYCQFNFSRVKLWDVIVHFASHNRFMRISVRSHHSLRVDVVSVSLNHCCYRYVEESKQRF